MCNGELGRLNPSARPSAGGIPCGTLLKFPAPVGIRLPRIGRGQAGESVQKVLLRRRWPGRGKQEEMNYEPVR